MIDVRVNYMYNEISTTPKKGNIMRTVTVKVFQFNELSQEAQERAYNDWRENQNNFGYECNELRPFLDLIKQAGVTVKNWYYGLYEHGFDIENETISTDYDYVSMNEITGMRAAKMALGLYYGLITTKTAWQVNDGKKPSKTDLRWVKHIEAASVYRNNYNHLVERITDNNDNFLAFKYSNTSKHTGNTLVYYELKNSDAMKIKDTCFDGTWLGCEFTHALWDSVKENTSDGFTFYDHVSVAVGAIFKALEKECDYRQSMDCFIENYAYDTEYLKNGEIFYGSVQSEAA